MWVEENVKSLFEKMKQNKINPETEQPGNPEHYGKTSSTRIED